MIQANLSIPLHATTKTIGPLDVLHDPKMTVEAKRALLASWASDARAVPNCPALRRLDDGNLVLIDDVLNALKQLDQLPTSDVNRGWGQVESIRRGHWSRLARRWRTHRNDDDDDDPPTAPATVAPRFPLPGGALAAAA